MLSIVLLQVEGYIKKRKKKEQPLKIPLHILGGWIKVFSKSDERDKNTIPFVTSNIKFPGVF